MPRSDVEPTLPRPGISNEDIKFMQMGSRLFVIAGRFRAGAGRLGAGDRKLFISISLWTCEGIQMKIVEGILSSAMAARECRCHRPDDGPASEIGEQGRRDNVHPGRLLLLIDMLFGVIVATAGSIMGAVIDDYQSYAAYLWVVCVILPLIGMIFGFLGAVFAFKGEKFTIVLVGGILGLVAGIASGIIVYAGIVGLQLDRPPGVHLLHDRRDNGLRAEEELQLSG